MNKLFIVTSLREEEGMFKQESKNQSDIENSNQKVSHRGIWQLSFKVTFKSVDIIRFNIILEKDKVNIPATQANTVIKEYEV